MRLVSFTPQGANEISAGIQTTGGVGEAWRIAELAGISDLSAKQVSTRVLLGLTRTELASIAAAAESSQETLKAEGLLHPNGTVQLGPPIPDPQKIVCLGLNYRDHAAEAGLTAPNAPMFFAKFANSLIGPTAPIVPPRTTQQVDYEAELAVVIGAPGRYIKVEQALEHVAGAMAFNDVSARDLQMANNLWSGGKAIDTFGPCGPALVTLDEIEDLQALSVRTRVNGQTVQDGNTASMIFGVAETIAFLSQIMTLETGDIIATGTPAGVGNSRTPKLFLHPGDIVEVEIEGLGMLRNPVNGAA
jgi:acylpyruvate hydrolase